MERIIVNPQIHFGKPIIKGIRITVQNVLELINEGLSFGQIIKDYYPDLKKEDIQACMRQSALSESTPYYFPLLRVATSKITAAARTAPLAMYW